MSMKPTSIYPLRVAQLGMTDKPGTRGDTTDGLGTWGGMMDKPKNQ